MSESSAQRLRALGLRPKKSFGQNFLQDALLAARIAELATTPPGGTVLEIGAGAGALTEPLAARAGRVIAVERDRDLVPLLRGLFAADRVEIVEADAAQLDWLALLGAAPRPHAIAGNLPYQLTGKLLRMVVQAAAGIDRAVLMVQREVADRLTAAPATASYGALTVFAQAAFAIDRALRVPAGAFYPAPAVDSAVVVMTPLRPRRAEESRAFAELVRRAFAQRRKTLRNAWKGALGLSVAELEQRARAAGIDLDRRGETLTIEELAAMAQRGHRPQPNQ